jgi:hypothetical protein
MEVPWDRLRVNSSRPYGTFRLSNLYPGLRPGLSSAVPAGLILQSPGSHAHTLAPEVRSSEKSESSTSEAKEICGFFSVLRN